MNIALLRHAAELAAQWPSLILSEQRQIIAALIRGLQISDRGLDIPFHAGSLGSRNLASAASRPTQK